MDTVADTLDRSTRGGEFTAGAAAMLPWLVGIIPFGLVIGVSAAKADIPAVAGWLTGPLIYGGSAQIAAIDLLDVGAAPSVIVLTVVVINLRLVLYSAAMATRWRGQPLWWRMTAAYLLVDPSFVVGMARYERADPASGHHYYLGGAVTLWIAWIMAIGAGAAVGAELPAALRLEFVIPLYLVGEVVHRLADRATRRAAMTAAAVGAAAFAAPLHLGIVVAVVAGLIAGLTAGRSSR
jgi:predicted branched-subunit amino acid permease